jgi:ribosomal protein S7
MFGSLIVRGLKLRAYKRFSKLLVMIKRKERVEPRHIFLIACMRVTPRVAIKKLHRGTRIVFQPVPLPRTKQPSIVIQ